MHQDTPQVSEALKLLVEEIPGDNPCGMEALQNDLPL